MGSSTAAVGQVGPGVMPAQVLGGPIWWFFFGVYLLSILLALFTLVDSLRPKRRARLDAIIEPVWLYPLLGGAYLVCVFGAWIPALPRVLTVVPVALALPMIAVGVAYLLRVVFPKPGDVDDLAQTVVEEPDAEFAELPPQPDAEQSSEGDDAQGS